MAQRGDMRDLAGVSRQNDDVRPMDRLERILAVHVPRVVVGPNPVGAADGAKALEKTCHG